MKAWIGLALAVTSIVIAAAPEAKADYQQCCTNPIRWSSGAVNMKWCTSSFSAGDTWTPMIQEAADEWDNVSNSAADFTVTSDSSCAMSNSDNETWFTSGSNPDNFIAAEFSSYTGGGGGGCAGGAPCCSGCSAPTMVESDIIVYGQSTAGATITWFGGLPIGETSSPDIAGNFIVVTYQHEMGHTLGMTHTANGMVRMSTASPNGGWFQNGTSPVQPLTTDRSDAAALYPGAGTFSSIYSSNTQTDSSNNVSRPLSYDPTTDTSAYYPRNTTPIAGQLVNRVRVGQQIQVRFCRGNLGNATTGLIDQRVYRSTNKVYDVSDVNVLTYAATSATAYSKGCFTGNVTIAAGTPNGTYYLLLGQGTSTTGQFIATQDRPFVVIP